MKITKIETNYKRNLFLKETQNIKFQNYTNSLENQVIQIYPSIHYQTFFGFGGAFTEATSYAINQLPDKIANNLFKEYFSKEGLHYTLCRLTIGSSDFSLSSYSYSNKEDLSDFSIKPDYAYIIPTIHYAQKINPNLQFLASPWTPPKFMKSNQSLYSGGKLIKKYYKTWANYLVKYIKAYEKEKIYISYITIQNEPNATQIWESCIYTPEEEIDFAVNYLFPVFKANNISTKILIWDHNKEKLFTRTTQEIVNTSAFSAISGIAFHWYTGDHFENIYLTQKAFPGKLLIHTEGCTGYSKFKSKDEVNNAEIYGHDILGDLNAGVNGYIDWNMVLDYKGGPNHKENYCNAPIMLNRVNDNYIKNLTFYYIGHFSKFIQPYAKRIAFSRYSTDIEVTAFKNPDNTIAIVMLNRTNLNKEYNLIIENIVIHDNLDSHAIVSYTIK